MASVWFEGLDQLNTLAADLTKGAEKVTGPLAQAVVRKTALDVERDAKQFAPVDTGNLRSSIGHSDLRRVGQSGSLEAEIGPTAAYGHFVEHGTSRMAPSAFMGPALDRNTPSFFEAVQQLGGQIL